MDALRRADGRARHVDRGGIVPRLFVAQAFDRIHNRRFCRLIAYKEPTNRSGYNADGITQAQSAFAGRDQILSEIDLSVAISEAV